MFGSRLLSCLNSGASSNSNNCQEFSRDVNENNDYPLGALQTKRLTVKNDFVCVRVCVSCVGMIQIDAKQLPPNRGPANTAVRKKKKKNKIVL